RSAFSTKRCSSTTYSRGCRHPVTGVCRWYPQPGDLVNRFFRSALFPLVIIAALVWLAITTLGHSGSSSTSKPFSQVYSKAQNNPQQIQSVTFDPSKQEIDAMVGSQKWVAHYASDQDQHSLQQVLQNAISTGKAPNLTVSSKGVGSSPWWSILSSLLPFVLLFGFWIFLMNQVQGG